MEEHNRKMKKRGFRPTAGYFMKSLRNKRLETIYLRRILKTAVFLGQNLNRGWGFFNPCTIPSRRETLHRHCVCRSISLSSGKYEAARDKSALKHGHRLRHERKGSDGGHHPGELRCWRYRARDVRLVISEQ